MAKRPGNPNWVKGKSGNPTGPKPGKYRKMLDAAMTAQSKKERKTLIEHAVQVAYKDHSVLTAILKKILPDLKSIEAKLDTESPFRLILEYAPTAKTPKADKQEKQSRNSNIADSSRLITSPCTNPNGHDIQVHTNDDGMKYWQCEHCNISSSTAHQIGRGSKPPKTDKPESKTRPGGKGH